MIDARPATRNRAGVEVPMNASVSRGFLFHPLYFKQHFLYFLPLPHGQGSFLPTLTFALRL
jgi:hypothetical protein